MPSHSSAALCTTTAHQKIRSLRQIRIPHPPSPHHPSRRSPLRRRARRYALHPRLAPASAASASSKRIRRGREGPGRRDPDWGEGDFDAGGKVEAGLLFLKGSLAPSCSCKGSLSSTFTRVVPNCQSEPLRCDSISGKKKDEKKRERESPPSLSSDRSWRSLERPPTFQPYSRYRIKLVLSGRSCNPAASALPFSPSLPLPSSTGERVAFPRPAQNLRHLPALASATQEPQRVCYTAPTRRPLDPPLSQG